MANVSNNVIDFDEVNNMADDFEKLCGADKFNVLLDCVKESLDDENLIAEIIATFYASKSTRKTLVDSINEFKNKA